MPSELSVEAWVRLLRAHQASFSKVEAALKRNGYPPLNWYDVLLELERRGKEGLRPYELEHELLLPQYGISRLVDRIAREGYLRRENCEDDGRGQRLIITKSGKELRQKMWRVYGHAIEDAVGTKLTAAEARKLSDLLGRLID